MTTPTRLDKAAVGTTAAAAFFGFCALLTLAVSIPATYAALRLFHDDGGPGGPWLAGFALLVFEVGAVGAKLATLAIPEWRGRLTMLTVTLLTLTTLANYAHGYDLSQAAQASPTLAAVLRDEVGARLATGAAAALFPSLLLVFLSAFVARCEVAVRRQVDTTAPAALQVTQAVQVNVSSAPAVAHHDAPALSKTARVRQLAAQAGVSESTIRRHIEKGKVTL